MYFPDLEPCTYSSLSVSLVWLCSPFEVLARERTLIQLKSGPYKQRNEGTNLTGVGDLGRSHCRVHSALYDDAIASRRPDVCR
jgi:hypothetical protein